MGIDIRDGLQMECIACGLCIDACNDVMHKLELPEGLIRYDTTSNQESRRVGGTDTFNIWRPRTFYYAAIIAVVGGAILYGLMTRSSTELHVLHDRNPLFVQLSDGSIRNGYDIKILNKTHEDRTFVLTVEDLPGAEIRVQGAGQLEADSLPVFADSVGHFRVFLSAPKPNDIRANIRFKIADETGQDIQYYEGVFMSGRP